jgi:hypothetical protein
MTRHHSRLRLATVNGVRILREPVLHQDARSRLEAESVRLMRLLVARKPRAAAVMAATLLSLLDDDDRGGAA